MINSVIKLQNRRCSVRSTLAHRVASASHTRLMEVRNVKVRAAATSIDRAFSRSLLPLASRRTRHRRRCCERKEKRDSLCRVGPGQHDVHMYVLV